ncbi:hypothetical protein [Mycobacteroides abscessus]|uniref:hypothetical protein n=1 Tax=Mycobacteroides abscessus TaxID=36809 RepID=UPI001300166A|nr:hypothetical protein [Mycobacteroides abscessus]
MSKKQSAKNAHTSPHLNSVAPVDHRYEAQHHLGVQAGVQVGSKLTPLPTLEDLEVKLDLRDGKWVLSKTTKAAIQRLFVANCQETEKAYGNCRNCYGKGYATVKSQIIGYGTDGDIGGYEGKYKRDNQVQMNYCGCERGRQLEALNSAAITNARIQELGAVVSGLQEGYVPSIISIQQMKDRLATLQKQLEEDKDQ